MAKRTYGNKRRRENESITTHRNNGIRNLSVHAQGNIMSDYPNDDPRSASNSTNNDLDECLAEMESSIFLGERSINGDEFNTIASAATPTENAAMSNSSPKEENNNVHTSASRHHRHNKFNRDQVEAWNISFLEWTRHRSHVHRKISNGASSSSSQGTDLFPHIHVELSRHYKIMALSTFLIEECQRRGVELRMPSFERWLLDAKLEDNDHHVASSLSQHHYQDPVLPSQISVQSDASQRLMQEICQSRQQQQQRNGGGDDKRRGIPMAVATKIVAQLCSKTVTTVQELAAERIQYLHQPPLGKGDYIVLEHHHHDNHNENNNNNDHDSHPNSKSTTTSTRGSHSYYSILLHRKKQTHPVCVKINVTHYDKLVERFLHVHQQTRSGNPRHAIPLGQPTTTSTKSTATANNKQQAKVMEGFHLLIMIVLLRYSSLSGGHLLKVWRGGGMQGACHDKVFEVLQEHLVKTTTASTTAISSSSTSILECFASPLNAHLPYFASAFYDVDWHFGSIGNFFSVDNDFYAKVGGLYQANPPFSPGLMKRMADTMIHHLTLADDEQHYDTALCFVVIVPTVHHLEKIKVTSAARTAQSNNAERHEEKEKEEESLVKRFAKPSFEILVASPFCRLHIILPAREHSYLVGAQHVRPTQYKQSNYDTSVIVLQSRRARETMTFDAQRLEEDIRKAFASREEEETEQRRQAKRVKTQRKS